MDEQQVINIEIPAPHSSSQSEFVRCVSKRIMLKAGRRFGKTVGVAIKALEAFLGICSGCGGKGCTNCDSTGRIKPKRVLYAAPTAEQVGKFWFEISTALAPGVKAKELKQNDTEKYIEIPGTERRIKAKTAWNANTLRGDYADLLIMEEYQLMNEDAWGEVGLPMLLDNNGDAVFIFTPPSLKSEGTSKARDPRHASKLFKIAEADKSSRWATFHFTSYDNPTLSKDALREITTDMSVDAHRREILAQDDEVEQSWLVYSKFDESYSKINRFSIPDNWPLYSGHDFGKSNPAALFVAEVRLPLPKGAPNKLRRGDYVAFIEYVPGGGLSAAQHVDNFKKMTTIYSIAGSVGGNITTEDEIRQLYRKEGWPIKAPSLSRINSQIDRTIALMENKRLYVFGDMFRLLGELNDCMWILDEQNIPTDKIKGEHKYHILSCLRYLSTILDIGLPGEYEEEGETHWDDVDIKPRRRVLAGGSHGRQL